ncbi:hypothetical protein BUALT_Bualt03G0189100 [Buddleja alternifolia]|uniref:TCP domain-containing protein n=1 Tax=Buddleja alternifolia TaxID=168488 RepID=A0AAV6Y288_9LAMI|nr:hypothetical protein BUALT_Bualt03G0189100 [Buddleja alternifolia]
MKGTRGAGEIVQVQGGHILRSSSGRKDRHSKVYTSNGPKDRRVRLSAHTAIQFYDVQDRLGYDRPSKAVDWLINKAKTAIDKLDEYEYLPPHWQPNLSAAAAITDNSNPSSSETPDYSSYPLIQQPNIINSSIMAEPTHLMNNMKSFIPITSSLSFPDFASDSALTRASFQGENLGLYVHADHDHGNLSNPVLTSQNGWNTTPTNHNNRVGFLMNSHEISQQQQGLLFSQDNQLPFRGGESSSHFEFGFGIPAPADGEEQELQTHH